MSEKILEGMAMAYYRFFYRPFMAFMHKRGWHRMKHLNPYPPQTQFPDGFLKCDWCGIHSDIPYSMRREKVEAEIRKAAGATQ